MHRKSILIYIVSTLLCLLMLVSCTAVPTAEPETPTSDAPIDTTPEEPVSLPDYTEATWGEGDVNRFRITLGKWDNDVLIMKGTGIDMDGKFTLNGVGATTGNDIEMGDWTHHEWVLDYTNNTIQFWQDGVAVTNANTASPYYGSPLMEMTADGLTYGFEGIAFRWNATKGNVGVDNMNIEYDLTMPYVRTADFGSGNAAGGKVLATTQNIAVEIPGMVYTADGTGTMADYVSLIKADGTPVLGATASMASDGKTINISVPNGALVAGESYAIKLNSGVPYGREGHTIKPKDPNGGNPTTYSCTVKTTTAPSLYHFTAVSTLK